MNYYITTPLYYVNDEPHIGHVYTTVAADCLARYKRMSGCRTFFLTGTDEHGQKVAEAASKKQCQPQELADRMAAVYSELWSQLEISYDRFFRTTEPEHEKVVQTVFTRLLQQGDIYRGEYQGWYCVHEENYVTPVLENSQRLCPDCRRPVREVAEPSYFFRLSAYQEKVRQHILTYPDFVQPDFRRNEVLSFLSQGLLDLSVTRKNVSWGIPSPTPERYPVYVWFDALLNYLTGVGYLCQEETFTAFWPPSVQLIGKDIIRFHHIIWPAILMTLNLPLPEKIFAHGWWLVNRDKMSKSLGNVVSPRDVLKEYGSSAFRFFLLREVPFGLDGEYSETNFCKRYNSDLANDLGNLVNRTLNLVEKKCGGRIPEGQVEEVNRLTEEVQSLFREKMERLAYSEAIETVWRLVIHLNKFLDEKAPWRYQGEQAGRLLRPVVEGIRRVALFLSPFIPAACRDIYKMLGLQTDPAAGNWKDLFSPLPAGQNLGPRFILFPRRPP